MTNTTFDIPYLKNQDNQPMKPQPTRNTALEKFLLAMTLLFCTTQVLAQRPTAESYFGLKAAANFSSNSFKDPSLADYNVKSKTGFAGGIYYNISFSEKFSVQPELLYSQMGSELESTVDESNNASLDLGYASVPLLFKFSPIERLGLFAGPQLDFMTDKKINYESGDDDDNVTQLNSIDFALTAGAEFWITKNIGVYGRYILGLSNQNAQNPGLWLNDEVVTGKITNSAIQVGVTIGFPAGESIYTPKDSDGDGISDNEDKCPDVAGTANNLGCPDMVLYYSHSEANLDSADMMNLDKVVTFLNNNPSLNIVIEGYTSTEGESDFNQKLSEKRANASMEYLLSKGISKKRMKAIGYGEQFAIGDNDTEEGKIKSRRVVIRVAK